MNPELTATLAARHCRELVATASARPGPAPASRPRSARRLLPRYRVTWTRIPLVLGDSGRPRTSSWAIVISASRPR